MISLQRWWQILEDIAYERDAEVLMYMDVKRLSASMWISVIWKLNSLNRLSK